MSPGKPTYKELENRLGRSEAIIASLTGGEIDAVMSGEHISVLRTVEDVETMRRIRCELEHLIEERTAELAQSQEKYRRVVNNIHDALLTDDVQGCVTYTNDRFLQIFGFSRQDVGSLKLEDYVAPEWRSVLRARHDRRMRGEDVPPLFEYEAVRPDGKRFWVEELVTPDVENGTIVGTQSSIRDITERKLAIQALRESASRYRQLVEAVTAYIYSVEVRDGRPVSTKHSAGFLAVTGYTTEALESDHELWQSMIDARDRQNVLDQVALVLNGVTVPPIEHRIIHRDGTERWVRNTIVLFRDSDGRLIRYDGLVEDITERKRAELSLAESQNELDSIVRTVPDIIFRLDPERRITYISSAVEKYGYKTWELLGTDFMELVCPEDRERADFRVNERRTKERRTVSFEVRLLTKAKSNAPVKAEATGYEKLPIFLVDAQGLYFSNESSTNTFIGTQAIARDITESKKAETALRISEASLAEAQRIALLGSWEWNIGEDKLSWSDQTFRIFRIKPRQFEISFEVFLTFVHPEDREAVKKAVNESLEGKRHFDLDHRIITGDGIERFVHEKGEIEFDGGGNPVRMFGMIQDITERKNAQRTISQFKSTLDQILDAVFMFDPETLKYIYVNRGAVDMTGYSQDELLTKTPLDLIPEITGDRWKEMLAQLSNKDKGSLLFETVHKTKSDSPIPVEIFLQYIDSNGERSRFVAIARDITERKKAEKAIDESKMLRLELEHMSRVVSLSGLTASIAHELNQPLTAIRSNAQAAVRFLSWDTPNIDEVRKALADIIKDNRRADDVIHGLRNLVKKETFQQTTFDLNATVREISSLLYHEVLEHNISIRMDLAADLPPVYGDRIAVSQVVLNLMLNGFQAMAGLEIRQRELVVRTRKAGPITVEFSVMDYGSGIGEDQREQIFKPFYTTKADGMGMGLAICRSIVEANEGLIWFTNEPDRGANFHFTLPVFRKSQA